MAGAGRCDWCGDDPLYVAYHDTEWGVPERDGRALWEKLVLDGFQAGLSWITILRKRDAFREAFRRVSIRRCHRRLGRGGCHSPAFRQSGNRAPSAARSKRRSAMPGPISRSRRGRGSRTSSGAMWTEFRCRTRFRAQADVPAKTALSAWLSADLRRAGFRFCGPTIVYAWMEATGLVNDHLVTCPRHEAVAAME
jgi:DNA-3-methyladenine glycosylase I